MKTPIRDRHANGGQGMNWIRKEKRLAIYLRDGLACCYCGAAVEDGAKLTLDHIKPHDHGGSNEPSNLVTACHRCNSARGCRTVPAFARRVAGYVNHGVTAAQITAHINRTVKGVVDTALAKDLISRRGGFAAALKAASMN